jgi:DNA-binding NarL/FixJ family response regulator
VTVDTSIADALSEREREVFSLLAQGLNNADIAARLYLSEGTVRNYVSSIFVKLGVSDRTQAAVLAMRYGLVDLSK